MLQSRSRRRTNHRKNISLIFISMAIVLGMVIGLGTNLVQSDTQTRYNPQFIENEGSMSKKSDVSVEVSNKQKNSVQRPEENLNDSSSGHGNVSNLDHKTQSGNSDDTPSVLVSDNPNNAFPQTGEAANSLSLIGITILCTMFSLLSIKIFNKLNNTSNYSKL